MFKGVCGGCSEKTPSRCNNFAYDKSSCKIPTPLGSLLSVQVSMADVGFPDPLPHQPRYQKFHMSNLWKHQYQGLRECYLWYEYGSVSSVPDTGS